VAAPKQGEVSSLAARQVRSSGVLVSVRVEPRGLLIWVPQQDPDLVVPVSVR